MRREEEFDGLVYDARCSIAATAAALADLAEAPSLLGVQSHIGGVAAAEIVWGCARSLMSLDAELARRAGGSR